MLNTATKIALTTCMPLLLVACGSFADKQASASPAITSQQTRSGVIDIRNGKPGAPVALEYRLPATIAPGGTVDVSLNFRTSTPKGTLEVRLNGGNNLEVAGPESASFPLGSSNTYPLNTRIATQGAGVFYLNVLATETLPNGNRSVRAMAVPVQVGDVPLQKSSPGKLQKDKSGQQLIIMPAEESP